MRAHITVERLLASADKFVKLGYAVDRHLEAKDQWGRKAVTVERMLRVWCRTVKLTARGNDCSAGPADRRGSGAAVGIWHSRKAGARWSEHWSRPGGSWGWYTVELLLVDVQQDRKARVVVLLDVPSLQDCYCVDSVPLHG